MQIQNQFEIPVPPAAAWPLLMNFPVVVPCFPGAELVEAVDADNYKGRVTVKLGPLKMVFAGKLRIEMRNDANHSIAVKATWTETKGRGNAATVTHFAMQEQGGGTLVVMDTDLQLAGQVAQYGRGAGMITGVSAQLISQFADNLRAQIQAMSAASDGQIPAQPGASGQPEISGLTVLGKVLVARMKRPL